MGKSTWSTADTKITLGLFGSTIGAAGWILGATFELMSATKQTADMLLDIVVVLSCAFGVMLTGVFIWALYLSGRRLSCFLVIETLLGASFVFGVVAVAWMHARGVLPLILGAHVGSGQPGNELWVTIGRWLPPEIVWAAPLLILVTMLVFWWPPLRRRMFGLLIQRGT